MIEEYRKKIEIIEDMVESLEITNSLDMQKSFDIEDELEKLGDIIKSSRQLHVQLNSDLNRAYISVILARSIVNNNIAREIKRRS